MKFTINQSTLNKALQICSKATGDFLPASQCFRFKIDENLEITCCNNEFSISTAIECETDGKCDILINADKLKAWVNSLPNRPIIFKVDKQVTITAGKATCSLPFEDGKDMPIIKHESTGEFSLPYADLSEAIFKTAYARRPDNGIGDLRCGLSIEFTEDHISFFATNGDRMASHFINEVIKSDNIILPYNFVNLLNGLILNGDADISVSKNSLKLICDGYTITGSLMGGIFFAWKGAIPNYDSYIALDKSELSGALKRLLILCDKFTSKVIFDLSPLGISISAIDHSFSQSANEDLTGTYSGSQLKIAFNGQYLIDMVSRFESETINFFFGTSMQPGIFKREIGDISFSAIGAMEI